MVTVHAGNQIELTCRDYEEMYARPMWPAWETGRPQPAVLRWHAAGIVRGHVLDAGCGSGNNAVYLAGQGLRVTGFDFSAGAVRAAVTRAEHQGIDPSLLRLVVADALTFDPDERFDTVVDSAHYHCLNRSQRPLYLRRLRNLCTTDGSLLMLTLSDQAPAGLPGPFRFGEHALRDAFTEAGWTVSGMRLTTYQTAWTGPRMAAYLDELGLTGPNFDDLSVDPDGHVVVPVWETHARPSHGGAR